MRKEQKQKPFISGVQQETLNPGFHKRNNLAPMGIRERNRCLRLKLDQYKRELPTSTMSPTPIHARAAYGKSKTMKRDCSIAQASRVEWKI